MQTSQNMLLSNAMEHKVRSPLLHKVLSKGSYSLVRKGESLSSSDESQKIVLVEKGYFKRFLISNQGKLGVQIIYGPEDVFPLTQVYDTLLNQEIYSGQETFYYQAICQSYIYSLDASIFAKEVQINPLLFKDLFSEAGQHLAFTVQRLESYALTNYSYHQLAHLLFFYAKKFGKQTPGGISIQLPFTHQDLADILNVNRETVTRSMLKLKENKLIVSGKIITVVDMSRLKNLAYS